jgi:hypothetical protein
MLDIECRQRFIEPYCNMSNQDSQHLNAVAQVISSIISVGVLSVNQGRPKHRKALQLTLDATLICQVDTSLEKFQSHDSGKSNGGGGRTCKPVNRRRVLPQNVHHHIRVKEHCSPSSAARLGGAVRGSTRDYR